jgi:hypothetical protein
MTAAAHSNVSPSPSSIASPDAEGPKARLADLVDAVVRFARARPFSAVGAAIVAGFVVGGALSFRGGRVLLAAGMRQAGQQLLKQLL